MVKRALPPLVLAVLLFRLSSSAASNAAATVRVAEDGPPPKPADVRALFLANCAQCHGEKGDGEGVTQLDRKARSFLGGGFSYGNTKEAILRSITHGIPGTPMPSFEKALTDEQRESLTKYVIAFGPDQIVVDPSESEMVVKDSPLVVRGKLPAIVEGGPEWPRGLAIGTPDGLTFEYRADDVQLLAVRAGRFVNRTDWSDRGGSPLEMLGKLVWTAPANTVSARDELGDNGDRRSARRLLATEVQGGGAWVEYAMPVLAGGTTRSVRVREGVRGAQCELGTGFIRRLRVRVPEGVPIEWAQHFGTPPASFEFQQEPVTPDTFVGVLRSKDRTRASELLAVVLPRTASCRGGADGIRATLNPDPTRSADREQEVLFVVLPSADVSRSTADNVQVLHRLAEALSR